MGKAAAASPPPQDPAIPQLQSQQRELEERLGRELAELRAAIDAAGESQKADLQAKIAEMSSSAGSPSMEGQLKVLEERQAKQAEELHSSIQALFEAKLAKSQEKNEQTLAALKTDIKGGSESQTFKALEDRIEESVEELMRGVEGSHNILQTRLQEMQDFCKDQVAESEERVGGKVEEEVERVETTLKSAIAQLVEECDAMRDEIDKLALGLEDARGIAEKADLELGAAFETQLANLEQVLGADTVQREADLLAATKAMTEELENEVRSEVGAIKRMSWTIDNMYTRSVTWKINGFRHKLAKLLEQQERRLVSPAFSLCSQPDWALDLLGAPEEEPSVAVPFPPLPTPGSCSIRLWAQPGYHIKFSITLGEGATAISKRFEHTFQASETTDSEGRVGYQMKNLCQLDDIWVKKANTVTVSLEVLELRYSGGSGGLLAEALEADLAATHDSKPDEAADPEAERAAKDAELEELVALHDNWAEDEITTSRSMTSESAMQEMLKAKLAVMQNRTVRRVEWRVENCTKLLEVLKAGEAVDSPIFSAAGIDKVQLHFYPRGCEVGDKTSLHGQACALYVSGPYRTNVKGILSVGSNARAFEQRYQRRGDVGGRGRFCVLDNQLDCEDAVTLSLEIVEVETDLPEMKASLLLREAKTPGSNATPSSPAHLGGGLKGKMSMKREDPSKTEEVVRCISLPSLNPRQQFLPKVVGNDRRGKGSR